MYRYNTIQSSGCMLHCQVRGPRFKHWPGQKFASTFLPHVYPSSTSWTTSQWIPEPVPGLEFTYGEEERVQPNGADISVIRKHERNPMTHEQKRRPENTKTQGRGEGNSTDTNGLVCSRLKDRKTNFPLTIRDFCSQTQCNIPNQ